MDGSNTVLVGTASGVVKARTIKWLPPGERWTGSLLNEAQGSELTPNLLEDGGGRVGIRALVLQPHAAVPLPPLVPEFRRVRRGPLRRTDFEQFGYAANCPGCANARAGRKQAVDHGSNIEQSCNSGFGVVTVSDSQLLGRTLTLRQWRTEYEPDQLHVSATPGTDDFGGHHASQISELRRTAKWRDPPYELEEEDDRLTGEELKLFQSLFCCM